MPSEIDWIQGIFIDWETEFKDLQISKEKKITSSIYS